LERFFRDCGCRIEVQVLPVTIGASCPFPVDTTIARSAGGDRAGSGWRRERDIPCESAGETIDGDTSIINKLGVAGAVGFVGATGALRTPLVGPLANNAGALQHDELAPDNAGPGMNITLSDSEREDGGFYVRRRSLSLRKRLSAAQDTHTENRKNNADLVKENFGVRLLSLRKLSGLWNLSVVGKRTTFGGSGDFDKAGFKIPPVPFIEGIVTAADEECPVPPFLLTVMLTESSREILSSADIAGDVLDRIRVVTEQEIDAVAVSLLSSEEASEGCARAGEDMAGPPRDVCGHDAAWIAINEEELDVFSTHGIISSQGR